MKILRNLLYVSRLIIVCILIAVITTVSVNSIWDGYTNSCATQESCSVYITTAIASGSGTLMGPNKVLTAKHIVKDGSPTYIVTESQRRVKVVDVITYKNKDIALLVLAESVNARYPKVDDVDTGDRITVHGIPKGGIYGKLYREGYVCGTEVKFAFPMNILSVADIQVMHGDSGAGVFDEDGDLVGVVNIIIPDTGSSVFDNLYAFCGFTPLSQFRELFQ